MGREMWTGKRWVDMAKGEMLREMGRQMGRDREWKWQYTVYGREIEKPMEIETTGLAMTSS
jgi:hypothetical protein